MKQLLIVLTLLFAVPSWAQHPGRGIQHHHGHHNDWVAPLIIGGVVGYALAQPRVYTAPPPPVVVYPQNTCPYPYIPFYNRVWALDVYGRQVLVDQFAGCR